MRPFSRVKSKKLRQKCCLTWIRLRSPCYNIRVGHWSRARRDQRPGAACLPPFSKLNQPKFPLPHSTSNPTESVTQSSEWAVNHRRRFPAYSAITLASSTANVTPSLASSGTRRTATCCLKPTPSARCSRRAHQPILLYPRNSSYYAAERLHKAVERTNSWNQNCLASCACAVCKRVWSSDSQWATRSAVGKPLRL